MQANPITMAGELSGTFNLNVNTIDQQARNSIALAIDPIDRGNGQAIRIYFQNGVLQLETITPPAPCTT